MTIHDALRRAHHALSGAQNETAWLDAELLLADTLHQPRAYLTAHAHEPLHHAALRQYTKAIARRSRFEPLAYITGEKEFYGRSFTVTPDTLIPRPATETLVDTVINHVSNKHNQLTIDIGTGSGCIAVTLAAHMPAARIIATDISETALAVARDNAIRHGVADRIAFVRGDLLVPVIPRFAMNQEHKKSRKQDNDAEGKSIHHAPYIVVANLPYLPSPLLQQKKELSYEPAQALDGGSDGASLYRALLRQLSSAIADQLLPPPEALFLETDEVTARLLLAPEIQILNTWFAVENRAPILTFMRRT